MSFINRLDTITKWASIPVFLGIFTSIGYCANHSATKSKLERREAALAIEAKELETTPGVLRVVREFDTNHDGKLSEGELLDAQQFGRAFISTIERLEAREKR